MPDHDAAELRRIDPSALATVLRRMAAQPAPPWLHGEVGKRMAERLALIRLRPQRLLDWWSFLGASAPLLATIYPQAQRVLVEPTPALMARSAQAHRAAWWSPRRLRGSSVQVRSEAQLEPSRAQLIWANMMLHAVQDPLGLMRRWQQLLSPEGFVMFSCFGPDTLGALGELYARLGWPAPTIAFVDMHDLGDMLLHAGFADPVMDQETLTLSWPNAAALIAELRGLGGNISPERFAALRTPRWRGRLEQALQGLQSGDGRISMRFEIAYGHAFNALPRARAGQATTVSLDEMRALVRAGHSKR